MWPRSIEGVISPFLPVSASSFASTHDWPPVIKTMIIKKCVQILCNKLCLREYVQVRYSHYKEINIPFQKRFHVFKDIHEISPKFYSTSLEFLSATPFQWQYEQISFSLNYYLIKQWECQKQQLVMEANTHTSSILTLCRSIRQVSVPFHHRDHKKSSLTTPMLTNGS